MVQRAIDPLRREGFVSSPHVDGGRFFHALVHEAARYTGAEPRRITVHYGVEDHSDNPAMELLGATVRAHTLAGLIFPEHPGTTRLGCSVLGTMRVESDCKRKEAVA